MAYIEPAMSSRQHITLRMRALHRLDRVLPFHRHPLRNGAPILSLTFDDIAESAARAGASTLEAAGVRGTFYVATALLGRDGEHWRHAGAGEIASLAAKGHEIGLHSSDHRPVAHVGRRAFTRDLSRNLDALRTLLPDAGLDNYAFPYGFSNTLHRRCLARSTRSCRTTNPGLNVGAADPRHLLSHPLGAGLRDDAHIDRLLDDATARGGWLILTLHDVCPTPSRYGCTARTLARAIDGALTRGMAIRPISEALDLCGLPGRVAA